jgi:hypothetical protein
LPKLIWQNYLRETIVKKGEGGQGTFALGIIIPVTLITLTLIALVLMNQVHGA